MEGTKATSPLLYFQAGANVKTLSQTILHPQLQNSCMFQVVPHESAALLTTPAIMLRAQGEEDCALPTDDSAIKINERAWNLDRGIYLPSPENGSGRKTLRRPTASHQARQARMSTG